MFTELNRRQCATCQFEMWSSKTGAEVEYISETTRHSELCLRAVTCF